MASTNVIILVIDTARAHAITPQTAPNLTGIAERGIEFANAFASAPWTLPSHAGLFTGTYSSKHGAHAGHKRLDEPHVTLAEAFSSASYETVAVSNNTWISEEFGFARGFEKFYKTWQYVQSETDLGEVAQTTEGIEMVRSFASRLTDGNPIVNLTNAVYGKFLRKQEDDGARQTNRWINNWLESRRTDRPFFLFVNYLEPHLEYRPPKVHAEQFLPDDCSFEKAMAVSQDAWGYIAGDVVLSERDFEILRALYRAEIAYLDQRIGELRTALIEAGEWEDTVFVVTGDHGENIGDHGLMDHQYCLYDTLLRVPLIINGGPFDNGRTVEYLVQLVDLPLTLLDIANISADKMRKQAQGQSFHPDVDTSRDHIIAEYMAPQPSMDALKKRVGTLPQDILTYDRSLRAIRTSDYKLIRGSDGLRECYNIDDDPNEQMDCADADPEWAVDLTTELDAWIDSFEHAETAGEVSINKSTEEKLERLGYLQ